MMGAHRGPNPWTKTLTWILSLSSPLRPYELSRGPLSFAFDRGEAEAQESSRNSPGGFTAVSGRTQICVARGGGCDD